MPRRHVRRDANPHLLAHPAAIDVDVVVVVDQGEGGLRGDEARLAEPLAVLVSMAGPADDD